MWYNKSKEHPLSHPTFLHKTQKTEAKIKSEQKPEKHMGKYLETRKNRTFEMETIWRHYTKQVQIGTKRGLYSIRFPHLRQRIKQASGGVGK